MLKNKGKRNIKFLLLTGPIEIKRTILKIQGDVDLKKYGLENKEIIPLDEYFEISKLPFKVSIKAMIEIAFWGQNQVSFNRASEIISRTLGITISPYNVRKITEYIGKIVYDYNYSEALKSWNNRMNLDINVRRHKGTLNIEADGATVNTRIEDENGSTWKENKLCIMFKNDQLYKRGDNTNMIMHKEYVSYIGNVDTFRILLFAKAVEMKYWTYENIVFISDGAIWLKNMIDELFPEAIQILDKYHLIENIHQYADFIFSGNTTKIEEFKCKIINLCYKNKPNEIIDELKKYNHIAIPKTICNLPTYIENNKNKINYSLYEKNGWFIGSGAIESSNKTIVQFRLKQAGMRWNINGANYMLTLRCYSESGHWHNIEEIVTNFFKNS